jgi:hypothetical protein
MKKADLVGGVLAMVVGVVFYVSAGTLPEFNLKLAGPAFFPELVAALQIFCAACLIGVTIYSGNKKASVKTNDQETENIKPILIAMTITVFYYLAMEYIGFWLATVLYSLSLSMLTQKQRSWLDAGVTSAGITGAVYAVFSLLLKASLPVGTLFR